MLSRICTLGVLGYAPGVHPNSCVVPGYPRVYLSVPNSWVWYPWYPRVPEYFIGVVPGYLEIID